VKIILFLTSLIEFKREKRPLTKVAIAEGERRGKFISIRGKLPSTCPPKPGPSLDFLLV
jgi:hypothetical protein